MYSALVVTVSDGAFAGRRVDTAGPAVRTLLEGAGFGVSGIVVVPDEDAQIREALIRGADRDRINLIVTVGGTGLGPRDISPEATAAVSERMVPGLAEAMRREGAAITRRALLSRGVAGVRGRTLILNLPGSEKGALENLGAVLDVLDHGLETLLGTGGDCAAPPALTHLDGAGRARMVDLSGKPATRREACAQALVTMRKETLALALGGAGPKGNVLETARLAGIMAAKRTWSLIPLCHPLPLDLVNVDISPSGDTRLRITSTVRCVWHTGVEMEALTAVSVAALTIYDMCKALDRTMEIGEILLLKKSGGRSGSFERRAPGENECWTPAAGG
jgi:cyclic pyranopterin phosphate synthase